VPLRIVPARRSGSSPRLRAIGVRHGEGQRAGGSRTGRAAGGKEDVITTPREIRRRDGRRGAGKSCCRRDRAGRARSIARIGPSRRFRASTVVVRYRPYLELIETDGRQELLGSGCARRPSAARERSSGPPRARRWRWFSSGDRASTAWPARAGAGGGRRVERRYRDRPGGFGAGAAAARLGAPLMLDYACNQPQRLAGALGRHLPALGKRRGRRPRRPPSTTRRAPSASSRSGRRRNPAPGTAPGRRPSDRHWRSDRRGAVEIADLATSRPGDHPCASIVIVALDDPGHPGPAGHPARLPGGDPAAGRHRPRPVDRRGVGGAPATSPGSRRRRPSAARSGKPSDRRAHGRAGRGGLRALDRRAGGAGGRGRDAPTTRSRSPARPAAAAQAGALLAYARRRPPWGPVRSSRDATMRRPPAAPSASPARCA